VLCTLNGHFAFKSVSGSATKWVGVSGFWTKLFKHLQSYPHILSATKMWPKEHSFWQYNAYADTHGGSRERGRQMRVGSLKMAIFISFVPLSSGHFTYVVTRQLSRDMTVNDLGHISR